MQKRKIISVILAVMLLSVIAVAQSSKKAGKANALEVSFNYQKQAGPGSNQYAVWIENEKGEFVKTLFITSYTTKGRARGGEQAKRGYIVRPACVPTWVKTSKAEEKTDVQLDAVTGATPQNGGIQTFTWDFTDENGKAVPQGTYKVKVEATLFFDSDSLLGFPESAAPAVFHFYKKKDAVLLGNQIDLSVPVLKIPLQNPDAVFLQEADCLLFSKSACLTSGNMFP